ncbi:MAG: Fur family transcriptional regulator [Lachnospiraceae bacterium]|nr:Fur family transcriptional regulator [Lachnospiraceae bacterium]
MKNTADKLREKGLKVTPQRMAIYSMLSNTVEHPNAETIYKALEADNPSMSLATVYKTLDSFQNANLVKELNVGEGRSRYDANVSPHPHLVCTYCHRVFDLDIKEFCDLRSKIENITDFEVEHEQLIFYGKCGECKKHAHQ